MLSHVSVFLLLYTLTSCDNLTSPKRGLVYTWSVPAGGDGIWDSSNSDLTWYYNYAAEPISTFDGSKLRFVPMMWGAGEHYTGFSATVQSLLGSGQPITHVLGFNEPDLCGPKSAGGSCISATKAARVWKQEIQPLRTKHNIKLGAPATTQGGLWWLQDFFTACDGQCTPDFLPLHYYGDFPGLAAYVGSMRQTYPTLPIWLTEFAFPNATVQDAKSFYNQTVDFLDSIPYVQRYSYFGSFRADDASTWLGPNGTMLNDAGELTDIGAWYLGERATGRRPESLAKARRPSVWFLFVLGLVWTVLGCVR